MIIFAAPPLVPVSPAPPDKPLTTLQQALDALGDLDIIIHGSTRYATIGLIREMVALEDKVIKLGSRLLYLTIFVAVLSVTTFFLLLAVGYLASGQKP